MIGAGAESVIAVSDPMRLETLTIRPNFVLKLEPALRALLEPAVRAGDLRVDIKPYELLRAVGNLLITHTADEARGNQRMVEVFVDGLRRGGPAPRHR